MGMWREEKEDMEKMQKRKKRKDGAAREMEEIEPETIFVNKKKVSE